MPRVATACTCDSTPGRRVSCSRTPRSRNDCCGGVRV